MKGNFGKADAPRAILAALVVCSAQTLPAQNDANVQEQLRQLKVQNEQLRQQLQRQQMLLDDLGRKVSGLPEGPRTTPEPPPLGRALGKLRLSGEGAVAFFDSGELGEFPNSEFRVDEAKLFVEAPLWTDVYVFTEINITLRDEREEYLRVGELYVDFENLGRWFNRDRGLNLRAGRFDIPFGEEYLTRDAIDNPLIAHSLSDLWGVDEGIQLYGTIGKFNYAVAVQNGGHPSLHDYNADKAVVGRLSFDPTPWLHLSGSAMRTGDLDVEDDEESEIWLANAFIRALGDPATTTTFRAELFEGDVQFTLPRGYVKGAGGYIHSDDNDTSGADNERDVYYYYVEGVLNLSKKVYAAARFSQIFAEHGFPLLAGSGEYGQFFVRELSTDLSRLSIGMGYRPSPNLLLKTDFTYNTGEALSGESRIHENFFGVEAAFKF